ncbi:type II toxin-antitoxin system RelE/ParE family toxin [Patescibacteria group bacterium AH-259-L07]|nr:type II toxin-antitoxin system RelE/ParE family toxin [Patescibacteria group bacterium AH-259-L07]
MIYNNSEKYNVYYYRNSQNGRVPVFEYIQKLSVKEKAKVAVYIKLLRDYKGYLDEPYSRYVRKGLRELRVDFSHNKHRVFYVLVEEKRIILLHAFLKKTAKTPKQEIIRALNNFEDYKNRSSLRSEEP